ncbi:MAG: C25 family cysteine peptidase [Thermoplasmatota archaeon]
MARRPKVIVMTISILLMFLSASFTHTGGSIYRAASTEMDSRCRISIVDIRTRLSITEAGGGPELDLIGSEISGDHLDMGITGGDQFEVVYDPTPGTPMIPLLATVIRIPGEIRDIGIMGDYGNIIELPDPIPLMPRATSPWEEAETQKYLTWTPPSEDPVVYSRIGFSHDRDQIYSVYSVWISLLHVRSPGTLSHNDDAEMVIEWEETGPDPNEGRSNGDPEDVPGTLSVTPYMEIRPEYLIITSDDLSDSLYRLADWRNDMGIATSVVTVEDIVSEYSGSADPADLIREYIRDVFTEWDDLEYVLLAGDWDKVPTKRVIDSDAYPGWDDGYIPADSYYQCLDGSWDGDGDGIYGEIGDLEDIIPDLAVSRLAINDPELWDLKIDQIIDYDLGSGEGYWSSEAVLIGANTHNEGDGTNHSEYLWEKYIEDAYSDKLTLYENENTLSKSSIDAALLDGAGFVNFIDHGGPNEWCDDYGRGIVYRSRDARALTNGADLPVISTLACLTTWFDDTSGSSYSFSECLGEAFTENPDGGGIGYVGSSRTSVGILGARKYLPYDNGLQEDFIRQISSVREFTLGRTYTGAKQHYAEVWGNQFHKTGNPEVSLCWLEYTLLGETAVNLRTAPSGEFEVDIFHEDDLDPYIFISVRDSSGEPVPHANVTLVNFQRNVFETVMTDENGDAAFDLVLDWFCDINLSVWKHNFDPYLGHVRISDVIPPATLLETDPALPDGDNGWFISNPKIRFAPNEAATVHYRIGTGSYISLNGSGNYSIPQLPEGAHKVHYFSEDIAGNLEEEKHTEIKIDLRDPSCRIMISPPNPDGMNGWYTTDPLITLESESDDPGAAVSFSYWTDDGEVRKYNGPFYLSEGKYQLRARAIDESGRESNVTWISISVDTSPPSTKCILNPDSPDGEEGWFTKTPSMSLSSDEEDAMIEFRFSPTDDFQAYEGPFRLPDGEYMIQYRSRDAAGNIDDTGSRNVRIDTESPYVSYTLQPGEPDGADGYYTTTPTLRMSWDDNIGASLWQRIDHGEVTRSSGLITIPDGEHAVEFFAVDMAGHQSEKVRMNFKVDTVIPETTVNLMGSRRGEWFVSPPTISLETTELCHTYYSFGSGEFTEYELPFQPPEQEGIFTMRYRSIDRAGNMGTTQSIRILVDSEGPRIDFSIDKRGDGSILLDLGDTEDGFDDIEYRIVKDGETISDWTYDPLIRFELPPGRHKLTIEARDQAGNTAAEQITVTVEGDGGSMIVYAGIIGLILIAAVIASLVIFIKGRKGSAYEYHGDHAYEHYRHYDDRYPPYQDDQNP